MYSSRWSPGLRQGDIVGKIPFPLPTKKAQFIATGAVTGTTLAPEMALIQTSPRYVAVISHDCEFNEGKRDHFLVARVTRLPKNLTEDELEEIRRENDIEVSAQTGHPNALDTFYLDPIEGVLDQPHRIDLSTITPFAIAAIDEMKKLKRAELDHDTRVLLRRKVGYFFGRDADDIPDAKKFDAPLVAAEE